MRRLVSVKTPGIYTQCAIFKKSFVHSEEIFSALFHVCRPGKIRPKKVKEMLSKKNSYLFLWIAFIKSVFNLLLSTNEETIIFKEVH